MASIEEIGLHALVPTVPGGQRVGDLDDLGSTSSGGFTPTLLMPGNQRVSSRDRWTRTALVGADLVGLVVAATFAVAVTGPAGEAFVLIAATGLALVLVQLFGLYARDAVVLRAGMLDELPRLLQALTFAAGLVVVVGPEVATVSTGLVTAWWGAGCATIPVSRKVARTVVRRHTSNDRVLIIGSGRIADLIASKADKHRELGLEIVGCIDAVGNGPRLLSTLPQLGSLNDIDHVIETERIDSVVIAFSAVPHDDLLDAIRRCKRRRVKISVVPRLFEVIGSRVELHDIEGLTLLGLRGPDRSRGALTAKRIMDVGGATAALILLAPLMAAIAVAVRLTSHGPVVFRQERIGRGQRPFSMYKFRTMVQDADLRKAEIQHLNECAGGKMFKIAHDPRVTRVGRFLRATSLDELPQFVNVLLGEMSIVGPRPLIREENDAVLGWHRTRLDLTPGLTGPWQVMGRQHVPFDEMVKLDYLYVAEWSLWNDIKLMLRTVPVMVRRTGA
ncbi:UDP-glucose:undecaprenyl-phosphate glucose-1-phosphate transferase [Paraconexibacter sp. AEG42_29]|uniref:UDP-glucose:undecaprenyl-phosphate glucose-1-phosphate transferase n=1 Tax=Paraconexibacter sp. AEG42_29 TaxID=2997339 RepID=A0AAU7AX22_9ACTN